MNIISVLSLAFAVYYTYQKRKEIFSFVTFFRLASKEQKLDVLSTTQSKELAWFLLLVVFLVSEINDYVVIPKYVPELSKYMESKMITVIIHAVLIFMWVIINRVTFESKQYKYGND
jgi:hypothetical protein